MSSTNGVAIYQGANHTCETPQPVADKNGVYERKYRMRKICMSMSMRGAATICLPTQLTRMLSGAHSQAALRVNSAETAVQSTVLSEETSLICTRSVGIKAVDCVCVRCDLQFSALNYDSWQLS
jgi:hypothetical protein